MSVDSKDNVAVNDNANVAVYDNVVININLFQGWEKPRVFHKNPWVVGFSPKTLGFCGFFEGFWVFPGFFISKAVFVEYKV